MALHLVIGIALLAQGGLLPVSASMLEVDTKPPTVVYEEVFPSPDGNTVLANQPITATLHDDGSGVDPSSVVITVRNSQNVLVATGSVSVLALDPRTKRFETSDVPLSADEWYSATVVARDFAGNAVSYTWKFRRMSLSVGRANTEIETTAGIRQVGNQWGFMPKLRVGQFTVTSGQTQHSGFGPIGQTVDLSTAQVEYDLDGQRHVATTKPYSAGSTVTVYKQLTKLKVEGTNTKTLLGQTVALAPITVDLPAGAENATISMPLRKSTAFVPATSCPTPDEYVEGCTPDPLRFFITEDFAGRLAEAKDLADQRQAIAPVESGQPAAVSAYLTDSPMFLMSLLPEAPNTSGAMEAARWVLVTLDNNHVIMGFDDELFGVLGGVVYPSNVAAPHPLQFEEACAAGYPCLSATVAGASASNPNCGSGRRGAACNEQVMKDCVIIDGYDRRFGDKCHQLAGFIEVVAPFRQGWQTLNTSIGFQVGTADNVSRYTDSPYGPVPNPRDELGLAFNSHDRETSQYSFGGADDSWWANRHDYYYCDGDELYFYGSDPNKNKPHHHFTEGVDSGWADEGSPPNMDADIYPYVGFKTLRFVQYKQTKDYISAGVLGKECAGYYDPDDKSNPGFRYFHRRYPLGRTYLNYIESEWRNARSADRGEGVVTWGHVSRHFVYDFDIDLFEFSAGCGFGHDARPGCGVDVIGFDIDPHEETKESTAYYLFNWCYNRSDC